MTDAASTFAAFALPRRERTTIFVVRYPEGWSLLSAGRSWGRFEFRVDAEEAALRLAAKAGGEAEVLVHETFGELHRLPLPER